MSEAFQREERYVVVKRKDFVTERDEQSLRDWMNKFCVEPVECVVVEHDWPIYDETWENVQRLSEGRPSIRDERDALAARVEELSELLSDALQGLQWFRDQHPNEDTESDAEFEERVIRALASRGSESLARREAQVKAEVLEKAMYKALSGAQPLTAHWLHEMAEEYRRQAERGEP